MHDSSAYGLIGVDGGGTSCRITLLWGDRRVDIKEASANVSTDMERALRTISAGLQRGAEELGVSHDTLLSWPAYLGLAGAISPALCKAVAEGLGLLQAKVEDDRHAALVGAFGVRDGLLIGIGTGSFLARQTGGRASYVGGYGLRVSDQASAGWLGRALLSETLKSVDGLQAHSDVTRATHEEFGEASERIVAFARTATPADYGSFAPRLFEGAKNRDPIAAKIITEASTYITEAATALGWTAGEAICLLGGVAPHYALYLPKDMQDAVQEPKGNAMDGALQMAAAIPLTMAANS